MSSESNCSALAWLKALDEKNWKCEPENEKRAYEVQGAVTGVAKEVWGEVIGLKIGLTSKESKARFGGGPIFGPIFEKEVLGNGSVINLSKLSDPILESEVFLCNGSYFVAFEVPDNRYGVKWGELNYLKLIADLAGSYRIVVGEEISELGGKAVLKGPNVSLEANVNLDRIKENEELLKSRFDEGCLLLGTVLPIVSAVEGEYVFECCGSKVKVEFI